MTKLTNRSARPTKPPRFSRRACTPVARMRDIQPLIL